MSRSQKITLYAAATIGVLPAPTANNPVWTADSFTYVTLRPAADGSYCDVYANGTLGTTNITVTVTGQSVLSFTTNITVTTDLASQLTVTASAALPQ